MSSEDKKAQLQGTIQHGEEEHSGRVRNSDLAEAFAQTGNVEPEPHMDVADFEGVHPADLAVQLEALSVEEQMHIVEHMPLVDAAEGIEEMEEHARAELLTSLDPALAADLLGEMSRDEAADVLDEIGDEHRIELLKHVDKEEAAHLENLLRFNPDTAGGIMNTEIMILDHNFTVDQAIAIIRRDIENAEMPYYLYLVDERNVLVGVPSLRDVLTGRPGTRLKELIKDQNLISVLFDVDKEEVAHQITHYNFLAMPVVDYQGKLLGVVTHDDVIDIIHEEASEDMLGMVGAGQDETVDTPWSESVKKRLPWLIINVVNSALAAWVVHIFEGTIAQMAILAALMHIVSNQAGNTGQQSLAVIIRQLAMERFDRKRSWVAVWREVKVGLVNGLLIGLLVFLCVLAVTQNLVLGEVMALALGSNMIIGAFAGASIPLILKELGRDPAQASSIFLTTITDCAGFFVFLGLAALMLL